MAEIIFLHGASSSGKSTIARALQARIEKPFWHISIDHLRESGVLPLMRFRKGDFDWRRSRAAFFHGFHMSLAAYANAGNNLILEHILEGEGWIELLQTLFRPHDVFFVAVHCPLDVLIDREAKRGDRPKGSAKHDYETIHVGRRYDMELNGDDDLNTNIDRLLAAWRRGERSSDFAATQSDHMDGG